MGAERTQYRYRQAERNLVDHVFLQGFDQSQSEADGQGGDDVDTAFGRLPASHTHVRMDDRLWFRSRLMIWRKCLSALCNSKEDLHDYNNWRSGSAGHCGARDKFSPKPALLCPARRSFIAKLARRFGDDDVLVVLNGHVRLSGPDGSVRNFIRVWGLSD